MSKISRDIAVLGEYKDTVFYTHTCSCGCGEQITIEVTAPEDLELVTIEMYAEVTCYNRNITYNCITDFFSELWWRVKNSVQVLIKGEIKLQAGICINSRQGVTDYIKALTEASKVFKS